MSVNTAATMLLRLAERGAVIKSAGTGKSALYSASERLFNIYYLMRRRSHPSDRVRALVSFMTDYYDRDELIDTATTLAREACSVRPDSRMDYHAFYDAILARVPTLVPILQAENQTKNAEDLLRDDVDQEDQIQSRRALVELLSDTDRQQEGIDLLRRAAERYRDWRLWADLGSFVLARDGNDEDAVGALEKSIALGAEDPIVFVSYAQALRRDGEPPQRLLALAQTRQARRTISDTIAKAAERFRSLPNVVRPAHLNLVGEAKKTHQNSIAASVDRKGNWENFPVAHIRGQGVRIDVNLQPKDIFVRIDESIEGLKDDFSRLNDVARFLENLKDDAEEWRKDFLTRVALAGRNLFAPYLGQATEMWEKCEKRYGGGAGYRVDVSGIFQEQFEDDTSAMMASQRVEGQVATVWEQIIIEPLNDATAFNEDD